jgi:hypothetical protein
MKIKTSNWTDDDYGQHIEIIIDDSKGGHKSLGFHDGEPEDNALSRNFSDCFSIIDCLKMAYEAGKASEEFTIEEVSPDEI